MSARLADLSVTMRNAYAMAQHNDGKLDRHAGGFWCGKLGRSGGWFGTSTVQALVKRDAAKYSLWNQGKFKSFPIQITIKPLSP